jgi:hypothetical protein
LRRTQESNVDLIAILSGVFVGWLAVLAFVLALCRAAAYADARREQPAERPRRSRLRVA